MKHKDVTEIREYWKGCFLLLKTLHLQDTDYQNAEADYKRIAGSSADTS